MKKNYIAPETEMINLSAEAEVMNTVNPFSDTTTTYDSNETSIEVEDDWSPTSKSLWED
ncbi:MAG: hypothetical protein IKH88_10515 [Prevotella sp.]|nr:hypothetical protein [Prevotella sp.]